VTSLTLGTVTDDSISFSWAPPDVPGNRLTNYNLTIQEASDAPSFILLPGTATSYTATSLNDTDIYRFWLTPINSFGPGTAIQFQANTVGGNHPYAVDNITLDYVLPNSFRISWTAPSGNGFPITGYQARTLSSSVWTTTPLSSSTLTFTFNNTAYGTRYAFKVRASNSKGLGPYGTAQVFINK